MLSGPPRREQQIAAAAARRRRRRARLAAVAARERRTPNAAPTRAPMPGAAADAAVDTGTNERVPPSMPTVSKAPFGDEARQQLPTEVLYPLDLELVHVRGMSVPVLVTHASRRREPACRRRAQRQDHHPRCRDRRANREAHQPRETNHHQQIDSDDERGLFASPSILTTLRSHSS